MKKIWQNIPIHYGTELFDICGMMIVLIIYLTLLSPIVTIPLNICGILDWNWIIILLPWMIWIIAYISFRMLAFFNL